MIKDKIFVAHAPPFTDFAEAKILSKPIKDKQGGFTVIDRIYDFNHPPVYDQEFRPIPETDTQFINALVICDTVEYNERSGVITLRHNEGDEQSQFSGKQTVFKMYAERFREIYPSDGEPFLLLAASGKDVILDNTGFNNDEIRTKRAYYNGWLRECRDLFSPDQSLTIGTLYMKLHREEQIQAVDPPIYEQHTKVIDCLPNLADPPEDDHNGEPLAENETAFLLHLKTSPVISYDEKEDVFFFMDAGRKCGVTSNRLKSIYGTQGSINYTLAIIGAQIHYFPSQEIPKIEMQQEQAETDKLISLLRKKTKCQKNAGRIIFHDSPCL